MSLAEFCRLCLTNCGPVGIAVYPDDIRRMKIQDCLSIIITDERFNICIECDKKLTCFYQFRKNSLRVQHEFANILKSIQPVHYEHEYFVPLDEHQNIYPHDFENQQAPMSNIYIDQELHLELIDNQNENLVNMTANDNMYYQMQTPVSPATTPVLIPHSQNVVQDSQQIEQLQNLECGYSEQQPVAENFTEEKYTEEAAQEDNDSFTYDDFDTRDSFPSDRNNVDNAIDKKIEEFIQGAGSKRNKGTSPKICTVCNKLFRTNFKLKQHMLTHEENNAKFVCNYDECNKAFKSRIGLKEHIARTHTGESNFTCSICDKKFLLRSYYLAHQKIHSKVRNFSCSMCEKTFKTKQHLVNHENFHYGIKSFVCNECDKTFTTKTNLEIHAKSHVQQEQFECDVCSKTFKTKNYWRVHQRTHSKDEQFECTQCDKSFIQRSDLKIHMKTHENIKDFVCEVCGEAFTRKYTLQIHTNRVHLKQKMFSCDTCSKSFARKSYLNQHKAKCLSDLSTVSSAKNLIKNFS